MLRREDRMRRHFFNPIAYLVLTMMTSRLAGNPSLSTPRGSARLIRGADVVLLNGNIWTGEPPPPNGGREKLAPRVGAVAISHGRILAVGTSDEIKAYIGENTKVIDLGGRLALPGFIDDHTHFIQGGF